MRPPSRVKVRAAAKVNLSLRVGGVAADGFHPVQTVYQAVSLYDDVIATPALEGNSVPQVPTVQGGFTLTWAEPRILTAATQLRFSGEQFDDDLNTPAYVLGAYAVWDASFSRAVTRGVNAFLSVENILDTEYDTARTPLRSIGWPRTLRVGARFTWQ